METDKFYIFPIEYHKELLSREDLHLAVCWHDEKLGGDTDKRVDNPFLFFKKGFSKHTASFKIGEKIHRPDVYEQMKREWRKVHGAEQERVLFIGFRR